MAFNLPKLPYDYDSLEPVIDKETMFLHHQKHHASYIEKLNLALEKYTEFKDLSINELLGKTQNLPEDIRQTVINNGGGHVNHSLFWEVMRPPREDNNPKGEILKAIEKNFKSFQDFKVQFTDKALSLFGSGWVFLVAEEGGSLKIKRHSFQNSPLLLGMKPILAIDLWEHAYYLKYQNRRAEYVENFWKVINWKKVEKYLL